MKHMPKGLENSNRTHWSVLTLFRAFGHLVLFGKYVIKVLYRSNKKNQHGVVNID